MFTFNLKITDLLFAVALALLLFFVTATASFAQTYYIGGPGDDICDIKVEQRIGNSPSCQEMGWTPFNSALEINQSMTSWRTPPPGGAPAGECVTTNITGTMMIERRVALSCGGSLGGSYLTATDCTIASGASSCSVNVDWGVLSPFGPVSLEENGVQISTANPGNLNRTISHGTTNYALFQGPIEEVTAAATASCESGSSWNGSQCAPDVVIPAQVTGLTATPQSCGTARNRLTWNSVSGATSYEVQINGGSWSSVGNVTNWNHNGTANISYTYRVRARNSAGAGPQSSQVSATTPNVCAPAQPSTPTATPGSCGTGAITLSWSAVAGATGYQVQYRQGSGAWTSPINASSPRTFTGLTAGASYTFQVRAINSGGSSPWSAFATTNAPDICVPATPTGLTATPQACSTGQINLNWNSVVGAEGYDIQINSGAWQSLGNVTSYTHSGLTANSNNTYRVRAWNSAGAGAASGQVSATAPNVCAPGTPTITATPHTCGSGQINVSWTAVSGALRYELRIDGGAWTNVGNTTTYNHTGLTANSNHSYQVRAINSGGPGTASGISNATAPNICAPSEPPAPTVAASSCGSGEVTAFWGSVAGATSYDLQYRLSSGGAWSVLTGVTSPRAVSGLNANTAYTFQLRATNSAGASPWSAFANVTAPNICAPAQVTGLSATPQACGTNRNRLTWSSVAGASGYDVQINGGTWTNVGNVTAWNHNAAANTNYTYRVRAWNSAGAGPQSSQVSATTPNTCPIPTANITASNCTIPTGNSSCTATVSWSSSNTTGPRSVRQNGSQFSTGASGALNRTLSHGNNTFTFVDNGVIRDTDNATASCVSGTIWTGSSCEVLQCTQSLCSLSEPIRPAPGFAIDCTSTEIGPYGCDYGTYFRSYCDLNFLPTSCVPPSSPPNEPPPPNVSAGSCGTGQITVTWGNVSGATGHNLQYRPTAGGSWTILNDVSSGEVVSGLTPGTGYEFQLQAWNASGNSPWSAFEMVNAPDLCAGTCNWDTIGDCIAGSCLGYPITETQVDDVNVRGGSCPDGDQAHYRSGSRRTQVECVCTIAPTSAPTLTATPGTCGTGQINLSWNTISGATGYELRINGGAWQDVGNITTYSHTGLAAESPNNYIVRAYNSDGNGPDSNRPGVLAPPECPINGSCGTRATSYPYTDTAWPGGSTYCAAGNPSLTPAFPPIGSSVIWECYGLNGGSDSPQCIASRDPAPGCGSAAGDTFTDQPTTNLCSTGTATWSDTIGNDGQFNWSCGPTACTANHRPDAPINLNATVGVCNSGAVTLDWNDIAGATSYSVYFSDGTFVANTLGSDLSSFSGTAGQSYSFYVRANSPLGLQSANSAVVSVSTATCPPTAELEVSVEGGPYTTTPGDVGNSDDVVMRWSSTDSSSCSATGLGFDTSGNTSGTDPVDVPDPGDSENFRVTCDGADSNTVTITTALPNFGAPTISLNEAAGTFDPVGLVYNNVPATIIIQNGGQSGSVSNADYRLEIRETDGTLIDVENRPMGTIAAGASFTETISLDGMPYGDFEIYLAADYPLSPDNVAETDETDNDWTYPMSTPPPNPNLSIEADRTQVPIDETVVLTWDVGLVYPMDCRVEGPGISPMIAFDPSVDGASFGSPYTTTPIVAKSNFVLTCVEPSTGTLWMDTAIVETVGKFEEI